MSSSNCCFLTCIQVSQEAGRVVWYSHVFQNFPRFIVIHTVKDQGLIEVNLSAILDPSDSKQFMLSPCHSFKSCALPLSLLLHHEL